MSHKHDRPPHPPGPIVTSHGESEKVGQQFLDLWERLVQARFEIDKLCDRAAYLHNMTEFSRLDGKRQGISLALSYMDDMGRAS